MKKLLIVFLGLSLILQCGWISQKRGLRFPGSKAHKIPLFSEEGSGGVLGCRPIDREVFLENRSHRRSWFSFRPFLETGRRMELAVGVILAVQSRGDEFPPFWKNPADHGLISIRLPRSDG